MINGGLAKVTTTFWAQVCRCETKLCLKIIRWDYLIKQILNFIEEFWVVYKIKIIFFVNEKMYRQICYENDQTNRRQSTINW